MHEARLWALLAHVSAKKALQGSKIEIKVFLGGKKENNMLSKNWPSMQIHDVLKASRKNIVSNQTC